MAVHIICLPEHRPARIAMPLTWEGGKYRGGQPKTWRGTFEDFKDQL